MNLHITAMEKCTDISECMMLEETRQATQADDYLNALTTYVLNGKLLTRVEVKDDMQSIGILR